jgi:hypothetical protein
LVDNIDNVIIRIVCEWMPNQYEAYPVIQAGMRRVSAEFVRHA